VHAGLKANTKKQKYQRILERKQATHPEQLCRGYPTEFRDFFAHCSSLGFEDRPDYRYVTSPSHGLVCSSSHRLVLLSMPYIASSGATLLAHSASVSVARYLKRIFKDLFERQAFEDDGVYDWDLLKKQQEQGGSRGPTSTSLCFSLLLLRCRLAMLVV
jgi:hypothetical protein